MTDKEKVAALTAMLERHQWANRDDFWGAGYCPECDEPETIAVGFGKPPVSNTHAPWCALAALIRTSRAKPK